MREKEATVRLRGGLGNQLFQYAAGLAKAKALGARLILDARQLPSTPQLINGVSHWPEQISDFQNGAMRILRSNQFDIRLARIRQIERAIGDRFPQTLGRFGIYANETNSSVETFNSIRKTRMSINAYCNSPSYFLESQIEIRSRISDLTNPSEDFVRDSARVTSEGPLGIHVRLGDYKNLTSIYGGVDVEYFANAVRLSKQIAGDRDVWLFSDEPELALSLLGESLPNLQVAPISDRLTNLESMLVMSKCNGLVASNSTFSWWAAHQMDQTKPIIFPRPFFASVAMPEPKSMLIENWIQLGRRLNSV